MPISVIYDPRYQTWDDWASLMCEAYADQQLGNPTGEETWKDWAAGFYGIDTFSRDGVPDPYQFDNWQDWATALVNVVTTSRLD
jgi:hypothetical protein